MRRVRDRLPSLPFPALLVLAAGWWVFGYMARRPEGAGLPSFDIYASSYPNIVYALRSLREGHGLLWNPLQNCGQPFPPATALSAFYPLHLVFLIADVDRGVLVIAFLHLVIAALGTYLLCREIGAVPRRSAAPSASSWELTCAGSPDGIRSRSSVRSCGCPGRSSGASASCAPPLAGPGAGSPSCWRSPCSPRSRRTRCSSTSSWRCAS